jgi:hypothetical protein
LRLSGAVQHQLSIYEQEAEASVAIGRLALLLGSIEAADLQSGWRLSNADMKAATLLRAAANLLNAGEINEVAYRYPKAAVLAVGVAGALFEWSGTQRADISERLARTEVPPFPITGNDLLSAGFEPGPTLGDRLNALERIWIDSAFQLDREQLLDRAK